ncbi:adenylosuccinate synthase [Flammeovirgaceae bacterium SG7u.111]|nr:adenylosuccinate synthase [Flammeovirgaceae bacterium SG7u.132]WPO36119.1 adenylosuccinate synthase [Flammeovirgaceae bacterium SG7u.111]
MDILLGLQWGDEGKGKVVDYLSPKYDVVARFQGGPNAGHTLEFEGRKHVLHQIPSGIFHENIENVIGNGVVLDPITLRKEIDQIKGYNHDVNKNLFVSRKAHLILPTHRLLDAALEKRKGDKKIGSTLKGIGPVYQDKIARTGLRVGDISDAILKKRYEEVTSWHKFLLDSLEFEYDLAENEAEFFESLEVMRGLNLIDSEYFLNDRFTSGKKVLAEGAQGAMLDIDFGSYPFVTSSNTSGAGACSGLGVAPSKVTGVFGIFKAYCTRVGSGPFPTELFDKDGELMGKIGREFGATTGRPRRCGWLDLPVLKYATVLSGTSELYMMKADVLNDFEEVKVCTHYKLADGSVVDRVPYDLENEVVEPVYKTFKGWQTDITKVNSYEDLPIELKEYIKYIEEVVSVPVKIVSTGPDRAETIIR